MALLSTTQHGIEWLKNFDADDRVAASLLIDNLMLVGASEFASKINTHLKTLVEQANDAGQMLAFYAESEVNKDEKKNILPFFPDSENGRAIGDGIPPVTVDPGTQDVGSEGIVATLITKFCKANSKACLSHPGPDALRKNKIRKIVIVTDFIGSGRRLYEMLEAFAKVATIQSWVSYHLISFHIVCYSATETGLGFLKSHSLRPDVSVHISCPVIDEAFEGEELGAIKLLCRKYPDRKSGFPFGFNNTGSLIAFSHGIPNNAPYILHGSQKGWKPLFQNRSTADADIDEFADSSDVLVRNSEKTLKIRNARSTLLKSEGELWLHTMLVLKAIQKKVRTAPKLSARLQLPLERVEEILKLASEAKWLTPKNSLTVLGRKELKWSRLPKEVLVIEGSNLYFPTQLRAS